MKSTRFIVGIFLILLMGLTLQAKTVKVVSPSGPLPTVVTTDQKSDKDSAADFCDYFSRVIGRQVAIAEVPADQGVIIHVGPDEFVKKHAPEIDKLFADGYIVKMVESGGRDHIILAGKIPPSSQWAVEQFLQDYCGVRWLFPDPKYGEIVPSRQSVTVDSALSKTYEPDYISRANLQMYYFTPARYYLRLRVRGYKFGSHEIQFIFSTEEFKEHPEWFAFFNGKRQWWKYGNGWQICTSNPETVDYAVKYVLKQFDSDEEYTQNSPVACIGQNDGAGWCECPECQKLVNSFSPPLTNSERWWYWVNQVAREVAKVYPDRRVESMAYASSSQPPRFKLEDNVAITKTFVLDNEIELAKEWMEKCKSVNLYSYMYGDYFLGFRHSPQAAKDFLKWGHDKLGAIAHASECGGDWTFDGPKFHYIQQLQWDVNVDVDTVMDDFCNSWYGSKAAQPMRAFWDRLEQIFERRRPVPYGMKNRRLLFYQWCGWVASSYVQPNDELQEYRLDDIEFLDKSIARALKVAPADDEGVQFRLARMSDAWQYFRTSVVSFLKYFPMPAQSPVVSARDKNRALKIAREIADLRVQRMYYMSKMRMYPSINPRMHRKAYWSGPEEMTLFAKERTLIDEFCTSVSTYMEKTDGLAKTLKFWQQVPATDNLYESAQTQIYMLNSDKLSNIIVNGGFETGDIKGWDVKGAGVRATKSQAHSGSFAATTAGSTTLSQRVMVSPMERYRLTVWGRYLKKPPATDVAMETIMDFYSGGNRIWSEPSRHMMRSKNPADGWVRLRSTVTIPIGADSVVVKLRQRASAKILWDDVIFEKIKAGPKFVHGLLSDDFNGESIDRKKWTPATESPGNIAPKITAGCMTFGDGNMYPLTSLARFDDLLKFEGKDRYRLRIHAKPLAANAKPSVLTWGIKTGTKRVSTKDSGMYWTHYFKSPKTPKPRLVCHAFQNGKLSMTNVYTGMHLEEKYDLEKLKNNANDVWYTFYFDPQNVTVYVSANGYDESAGSLIATYKHEIKDITANGPVYLKLASERYMLDDISLESPAIAARKDSQQGKTEQIKDDKKGLIMPGVTD